MSAVRERASIPKVIGGYRLGEKIGSGAMGTVYRAVQLRLGGEVALKLVRADEPQSEMCRRFLQEGVAAARIRHPNVVQVLDAGEEEGIAYLAMQLLEGETLAECLTRQARLPVPYAVDIILPVCAALQAAHDVGVLHRDLKPANIFLADVGRGEPEPMLLDFGICKIDGPVDAGLTQNPRFLGTPLYIAPEQADGQPGSALSDQYSLALSLYECLLGVRPFERHQHSLIHLLRHVAEGQIQPASELDQSIPEGLDLALSRALSKDPEVRFASIREFGAAILPYASETRRSLWQMTFVDVERTMASANGPVGDSHRHRRVHVSVESSPTHSSPPTPRATDTHDDADQGDFLSHSKLFGAAPASSRPSGAHPESTPSAASSLAPSSFDPAESSISRRTLPQIRHAEAPPPSAAALHQEPLSAPTNALPSRPGAVWSPDSVREEAPHSISSRPPLLPSSQPPPARADSRRVTIITWSIAGCIALVTLAATIGLVRHELSANSVPTYDTHIQVSPAHARLELDGELVGTGTLDARFNKDGAVHRLHISHPGYEPVTIVFQDQAPEESVRLRPHETLPSPTDSTPQQQSSADTAVDTKLQRPVATTQKPVAPAIQLPQTPRAAAAPQAAQSDAADPTTSVTGNDDAATHDDAAEQNEPAIVTGNLDPWAQ